MRKNKDKINATREEGIKQLEEGSKAHDNEACKKELNGIIDIEWATNADKPGHKAKKLFRSPFREKFLSRCVYKGKGDVPHYGYEHDPEAVRARLVQEGFRGPAEERAAREKQSRPGAPSWSRRREAIDPEDVVKELKRRAKAFIRMEGADDNCQKTVRAMLDVDATLGKQYGLNDNREIGSLLNEYVELRKNAAARCVVPIPKDNPFSEEKVRISHAKPWEEQPDSSGYREIELYGTKLKKRSRKKRR